MATGLSDILLVYHIQLFPYFRELVFHPVYYFYDFLFIVAKVGLFIFEVEQFLIKFGYLFVVV